MEKKSPGHTLSESVLGVIGVGNIGQAVIRRARPFGMKILGNDIVPIEPDFIIEQGVEMTSLEDLLSRADYISLNTSLTPQLLSPDQCRDLAPCQEECRLDQYRSRSCCA